VEQLIAGQKQTENLTRDGNKVIYQDEDWFEVIDISGQENTDSGGWAIEDTNTSKKLRPNDKVSVRYPDGRIEYDVKYKKVKKDAEEWKLEIL
jgi:hypothetical protein